MFPRRESGWKSTLRAGTRIPARVEPNARGKELIPDGHFIRIKDWEKYYENNRTRELRRLDFILVPNQHDGDGYRTLISMPNGTALFGAWILILEVASKCTPRGYLMRSAGIPHTAESISRMTGGNVKIISEALSVLCQSEIGWLEECSIADVTLELPPAKFASAGDKDRAHGRVDRLLKSHLGIMTPAGRLHERPVTCQWCGRDAGRDAKGVTNIRAHHFLPYGPKSNDTQVLFVCRSCHGFFETGKLTTQMILDRWSGVSPAEPCETPAEPSDNPASLARARRSEANGREEKRTEENGREAAAAPANGHQPAAAVWPLFAAAVRNNFQSTDDRLIEEVVCLAQGVYPAITDPQLADAIPEATRQDQRSGALYRITVPEVIRSWRRRLEANNGR